jgi:transcription elongation factor Elf1
MTRRLGGIHREAQVPACPKCKSRDVQPTGPPKVVKWTDRVTAACGACGNTWSSENRVLVDQARQMKWVA